MATICLGGAKGKRRSSGGKRHSDVKQTAQADARLHHLVIHADGNEHCAPAESFLDPAAADGLQKLITDAGAQPSIALDQLLQFTDEQRFLALDFLAALPRPCELKVGKRSYRELFDAVLALIGTSGGKIDVTRRAKRAAMEVAVLTLGDALELAAGQIHTALRDAGCQATRSASLLKELRSLAAESRRRYAVPTVGKSIQEALGDVAPPSGGELIVPPPWSISPAGVWQAASRELVAPAPLLVTERYRPATGDHELLKLAFRRGTEWREQIVERARIADSRKLIELAGIGLPVTSNNAKALVQFLADFEAVNLERLPVALVSATMGFHEVQGEEVFLWGNSVITGVTDSDDEETPRPAIEFRGADDGDNQIAEGFHAGGKFAGWRKAVAPLATYPRVRLAIYAALAAAMLRVLRTKNFIVDFAGPTTSGKTITLRTAASCWGNPNEGAENAALATWDSTRVFRERAPAVLSHLPFIVDDTKRARNSDEIVQTVYDIAQGRGRGRGTINGLARQSTWSTVMLTSGEQPITSFGQDGGAFARVLLLWGSPFGTTNQSTAALVRELNNAVCRHYGHAGPAFVEFILAERPHWQGWRERFGELAMHFQQRAGENAFAGRLAESLAAIALTAQLAHEALDLPWNFSDPISPIWDDVAAAAGEANRPAAALQHVFSWAQANEQRFHGRRRPHDSAPANGFAGTWELVTVPTSDGSTWLSLGFFPNVLEDILRQAGFEPKSTLFSWRDRGWLATGHDANAKGRTRRKIRLNGQTRWEVSIKKQAIDEVVGSVGTVGTAREHERA